MFESWPYTDLHNLNQDWMLEKIKGIPDVIKNEFNEILSNKNFHDSIKQQVDQYLSSLESNFINVRNYGAVGNGIADDTDAFNKALAASIGNGVVYVPGGTYLVRGITMPKGTVILGAGCSNTQLKSSGAEFIIYMDKNQCEVSGISFDGDNKARFGILVKTYGNVTINKCAFTKCITAGLSLDDAPLPHDVELQNTKTVFECYSVLNLGSGFHTATPDVSFDNCTAISNGQYDSTASNFNIDAAVKMSNCHAWNAADWQGYKRCNSSVTVTSGNSLFTNCHFEGGLLYSLTNSGNQNVYNSCFIYASFGENVVMESGHNTIYNAVTFGSTPSDESAAGVKNIFKCQNSYGINIVACNFPNNVTIIDGDNNKTFLLSNWDDNVNLLTDGTWNRSQHAQIAGNVAAFPFVEEARLDKEISGTNANITFTAEGTYNFKKAVQGATYNVVNTSSGSITLEMPGNNIQIPVGMSIVKIINNVAYVK